MRAGARGCATGTPATQWQNKKAKAKKLTCPPRKGQHVCTIHLIFGCRNSRSLFVFVLFFRKDGEESKRREQTWNQECTKNRARAAMRVVASILQSSSQAERFPPLFPMAQKQLSSGFYTGSAQNVEVAARKECPKIPPKGGSVNQPTKTICDWAKGRGTSPDKE